MRTLTAILTSAVLTITPVLADPSPLPAGKPAGVKKADLYLSPTWIWMGFAAIAIAGLELSKVKSSTPTTGTGS